MTKKELRTLIRERKKQHTLEQLQAYSISITHTLLKRIEKEENCSTIFLYHSLSDEVCTHHLIPELQAIGKKVLLPTVVGEELQLHQYTRDADLSMSSSYGIQESNGPLFTDYSSIDLAIIPGMAFTLQGDRLGRGKGYYDRLLPHLSCPLIGVAFPFQILPFIPTEAHDIRMTDVVTQ